MGFVNKQIGWSNESNLLQYILKQLVALTAVLSKISGGGTPYTPPYKVYSARITAQAGSALPPTVNIIENTLGITPTYIGGALGPNTGYVINITNGIFLQNKIWLTPSNDGNNGIKLAWLNTNQLIFYAPNGGSSMNEVYFEIRVYN